MSRVLHGIEKGISIQAENGDSVAEFLQGSAVPGGDAGEQDDAPLSSLYFRSDGKVYKKETDTNSTADWIQLGNVVLDDLVWRQELIRAATNVALTAGTTDPSGWADNDKGMIFSDFAVGEYVLGDVDGTPALWEITAVASPNITLAAASNALADGDKMVARNYLPDVGSAQEDGAFLLYAGSSIIKVADVDWEFADAINLTSGYASGNGTISSADSAQSAIQKLDGNQKDIQTASGLAQGDVHNGTFTGNLLADNQTSKALLQRIEDLLDELKGVEATGITTITTVDSVPHATVKCCKWICEAFEEATPANRKCFEILASNDGTNVDDTEYAKLKLGANFNLVIGIAISGANMVLQATSSTAGVTVRVRRIEVVKNTI